MKKRIRTIAILGSLIIGTGGWAPALAPGGDAPPERAVVPLSSPSRPAKISVSVMRGGITIRAHDGREVVVEAVTREKPLSDIIAPPRRPTVPAVPPGKSEEKTPAERLAGRQEDLAKRLADQEEMVNRIIGGLMTGTDQTLKRAQDRRKARERKTEGLKRISGSTSGLVIEEEDNIVRIHTQLMRTAVDLIILAPAASSLEIRSMMDGAILIEGIGGEIDINNVNGPVTVRNASGPVLVHTVNGDIDVTLIQTQEEKPMAFNTMNGDIDVTLPANTRAGLKMHAEQGEIYTDFDVKITRQPARPETSKMTDPGKFRITFDKSLYGTINGGGPEITLNTFTGNIYIRKGR